VLEDIPRVALACLPTPIHELPRLAQSLGGPRILIKRDDLTGLATGGNKVRKLEFLIADALRQGATTVITTGAAQSNHARQTAAAATRHGLRCVLVLGPAAPPQRGGNLLLDALLGARVRWAGERDRYAVMQEVAAEERAAGRVPYVIPLGGSNAIGATGYVLAMRELVRQAVEQALHIDHLVLATGSGGTQAGIITGARAFSFRGNVLGISVSETAEALGPNILDLAQLTATHLDLHFDLGTDDVQLNDTYLGEGYGIVGEREREAIRLVAHNEGLLLDPVYTGRAMAGLIDLIRQGAFSPKETVLFWHTGGAPALFSYGEELLGD
jgi:D-cysteine desulfhydrase family pyridoxal phosphate-dependent enzyme